MPGMDEDRLSEVLDEAECRQLLGRAVVGRIGFTEGALPAIQPVSFALAEEEIVIPTRQGSKVAVASRGAIVAFEVDEYDPVDRTGWNVTVVGPSRVISDAGEVRALDQLGARAWPPADNCCYVAVRIRLLRGRRIRRRPTEEEQVSAVDAHPATVRILPV
ncbi:MAG: pyridoxamine 5-phosphate oxidase-related FMN-binding protein [Modestobacter sp.]|nr:pyridoxamine 5-phosphate oxidase-related FMN-binding protein [Modestobacter sp.]